RLPRPWLDRRWLIATTNCRGPQSASRSTSASDINTSLTAPSRIGLQHTVAVRSCPRSPPAALRPKFTRFTGKYTPTDPMPLISIPRIGDQIILSSRGGGQTYPYVAMGGHPVDDLENCVESGRRPCPAAYPDLPSRSCAPARDSPTRR